MSYISKRGFTLIELLVVVAIIGLLSTITVVSFNNARIKSRDAKRKADLRQLNTTVQLWIANNPNQGLPGGAGGWCARIDGRYSGFRDAIVGGKYMSQLPHDPKYGGQQGDYYYYNINNVEYALFSKLENTSDPDYKIYNLSTPGCDSRELSATTPHFNYIIGPCKTLCSNL